jgi:hypothetical protein
MRVVLNLLKLSCFAVSLNVSFFAFSHVISSSNTPEELEVYLAKFTGEKEVLARAKLIKELANSLPSSSQFAWVIEQQSHQGKVVRANPDHPNQQMTVANVAMSAKATLLHWEITRLSQIYIDQVHTNSWQWAAYIDSNHTNKSQGLAVMLGVISDEKAGFLQQELVENKSEPSPLIKLLSNKDLLALVSKLPTVILSEQLLTNPVDEFSYQHIHLLPQTYQYADAIHLLKLANVQEKLTSQALMTIAREYSDRHEAQAFLIHQLNQPKVAWFAAAAIAQSTSDQLRQKILKIDKSTAAIDYAQQRKLVSSADKEQY